MYSGISLLRSPMGLEAIVTLMVRCPFIETNIQFFFTMGNHLRLSKGDRNSEVTVLVR